MEGEGGVVNKDNDTTSEIGDKYGWQGPDPPHIY